MTFFEGPMTVHESCRTIVRRLDVSSQSAAARLQTIKSRYPGIRHVRPGPQNTSNVSLSITSSDALP